MPATVDSFWPIATYTQMTSPPFWFRIVSIAIAVLPVLRSPMISSRCPRPIGIMLSIALTPVCSGSFTGCRPAIPGAMTSSGRRCGDWIGPLPSSGRASGSTTRPTSASPTGTLSSRPVVRTSSPSLMSKYSPSTTAPTELSSRLKTRPVAPLANWSISLAIALDSP